MKHGNSIHPHIGEKSPTKNMVDKKVSGATSGKTLPKSTGGLSRTRKTSAKGTRHK